MTLWALLPAAISLGLNIASTHEAGEAQVTGAKSLAATEAENRKFQLETFNKMVEKQKPFIEAGKEAIPLYSEAIRGRGGPMEGGLAQMQKGMIEEDTGSMTDHIKKISMQRLEAEEGERYKGRLSDMQKIGLGASGSAGQSAVNLGGALAGSYVRGGSALSEARMASGINRQNMWLQAAQSLSGLPSYFSARGGGASPAPTPTANAPVGLPMQTSLNTGFGGYV